MDRAWRSVRGTNIVATPIDMALATPATESLSLGEPNPVRRMSLSAGVQKKPTEGWKLLQATLADGRKPLLLRLAVLRAMRFYHGAQPKESRPHVLATMKALIDQGELADIAIEDLRQWQIWDLTADVVKRAALPQHKRETDE